MSRDPIKLQPRFILDSKNKVRSKWDPNSVIKRTEKEKSRVNNWIATTKVADEGKNVFHYGGLEGAYESYHATIDLYKNDLKSLEKSKQQLINQVSSITISIAPYAIVRKIPKSRIDKTLRNKDIDYFQADLGMNINVPRGKVNEIRFYLTLLGDGRESGNAQVISGFPNDLVERVNIIEGTIKVGIDNLLRLIPHPVPQIIANFVQMELNPWKINWGFNKIKVLFSEGNNHSVDWYISSNNLNQNFNCTITIKKRKNVKKVIGLAHAKWIYDPLDITMKDYVKRIFHRKVLTVGSDIKEIKLIPIQ